MRLLCIAVLLTLSTAVLAQTPIEVFGYLQSTYTKYQNDWEFAPPGGEANNRFNYMGINQLNVLLSKDLRDGLSGHINFEFVNDYSSSNGFGSFNLQEGYLRWDYRSWLKVKFGMVIPQFNAMFEIYNKSPLLPYVSPPVLYRMSYGNLINVFDILPQRALIHCNGAIPYQSVIFEYSAFAGNPPNSFISSSSNNLIPGYAAFGQSAVNYLSGGGRVGLLYGDVRGGVSIATDRANYRNFTKDSQGNTVNLGDVPRTKIGADLSVSLAGFTLSSEYLNVTSSIAQETRDSLNAWSSADPYDIGNSFDKDFFYATLLYKVNDELSVYTMIDHLNDQTNPWMFGLDGQTGYHVGACYSVNESVVLKLQVYQDRMRYDTGEPLNPIRHYTEMYISAGASYSF